ncbi:MAG TPA: hypothetical protein VFX46_02005 [Hyphomicrobiaceae bacterium]|jgi:hypothetical protein|nr:hypothetical protein [Hyphomicrobiaceae bacterium]
MFAGPDRDEDEIHWVIVRRVEFDWVGKPEEDSCGPRQVIEPCVRHCHSVFDRGGAEGLAVRQGFQDDLAWDAGAPPKVFRSGGENGGLRIDRLVQKQVLIAENRRELYRFHHTPPGESGITAPERA